MAMAFHMRCCAAVMAPRLTQGEVTCYDVFHGAVGWSPNPRVKSHHLVVVEHHGAMVGHKHKPGDLI